MNYENRKEYMKNYHIKNREKLNSRKRKKYLENKEIYSLRAKKWYQKNKEKVNLKNKIWAQNNKERKKELHQIRYKRDREKILEYSRQWYQKNKPRRQLKAKLWVERNKERVKELQRRWHQENKQKINEKNKKRRHTDLSYKIMINLRRRVLLALKENRKSTNTKNLLGIPNAEFLWKHLEKSFKEGMTRENHGKVWEIDHILPCAAFDLSDHNQQRQCFHYSNLQALFIHENRAKSDKIL